MRAWRGLGGFRAGLPFRPWLLRIAANVVTSHRRRRLLPLVPLSWVDHRTQSPEPSPEAQAERAAAATGVRSALDGLPDEQRHVIVLRYYADMSVPEIAQATGLRQGTVKSRLHRALARARLLLEPPAEVTR